MDLLVFFLFLGWANELNRVYLMDEGPVAFSMWMINLFGPGIIYIGLRRWTEKIWPRLARGWAAAGIAFLSSFMLPIGQTTIGPFLLYP